MRELKKQQFEFSVIMTIYNIEKYLEEAIESVINQTLDFKNNIEIILVNDGSPDNSDIICKKYKKKYPKNIVYIEKENGGVSSARNAGLEVATGKIINFLDSDDYFSENAFEKVSQYFKKNKKVDVAALNLINFEKASGSWVNQEYFKKTQTIDMKKEPHFMECQVGSSFVRREVALKYRYDENIKIHEDSHYLYRIFRDSPKCGTISDATYWHRIRNNGTSATQTIKHKNNVFNMSGYLLKNLIEFYKKKEDILPDFFQTFIILEFNYYVLEKIPTIELDKKEKEELKGYVQNVIENLSIENIKKHPFISETIKSRYILLKSDISLLYKDKFLENPELYLPNIEKIKVFIRKVINYTKRKINSVKRRLSK